MDTDRLLSILELILKREAENQLPAPQSAAATAQNGQPVGYHCDRASSVEQSVIGATMDQNEDMFGTQTMRDDEAESNGYPVVINTPPFDYKYPPSLFRPLGAADPAEKSEPQVVVKLASPDLGTEIPAEWLDPVDVLFDTLKDNQAATASLDAMIMNWLKIKRAEPQPGDMYTGYSRYHNSLYDSDGMLKRNSTKMITENGEIGFVVERCIKRGYLYSGDAPGNRCRYDSWIRPAVVKLKDGITPPVVDPEHPPEQI